MAFTQKDREALAQARRSLVELELKGQQAIGDVKRALYDCGLEPRGDLTWAAICSHADAIRDAHAVRQRLPRCTGRRMTAGSYTHRDVTMSVKLPDGSTVNAVAFDTDDFLRARVAETYHLPDGGAQNASAMWWPSTIPTPGATWMLHNLGLDARSGPAVVDDFGDLVLVGWRL